MSEQDPKLILAKKRKKRGGHRGQATQLIRRAETLLKDDSATTRELREVRTALRNMQELLNVFDDDIQAMIEDLDEFQKDMEESQKIFALLGQLFEKTDGAIGDIEMERDRQARAMATQSAVSASTATAVQPRPVEPVAKLPQLPLGTFNGDPLEWQQFYDSFSTTIDQNSNLSPSQKMKYLKENLKGEPATLLKGYLVTDAMYPQALGALKERYGDNEVVKFAHIQALLNLPAASADLPKLRKTVDECERHIRSLESLGLQEDTYGVIFTPLLLSKLPSEIQLELHRQNGTMKWEFPKLRELLKNELAARDRSERFQVKNTSQSSSETSGSNGYKKKIFSKPTDAALVQSGGPAKKWTKKCVYCGQPHFSDSCGRVKSVHNRKTELMKQKRCFICLSVKHRVHECDRKRACVYCSTENHHRSICPKREAEQGRAHDASNLNSEAPVFVPAAVHDTSLVTNHSNHPVLLQLATAPISGTRGMATARFLLDPGSSRSFIRQRLSADIGAKHVGSRTAAMSGFGSRRRKSVTYDVVEVEVKLHGGETETLSLCTIDHICCPVEKVPFKHTPVIDALPLAEPTSDNSELVGIDVLIGADLYYSLVNPTATQLGTDGLVMLESKFGFVVTGPVVHESGPNDDVMFFTGGDSRLDDLMNLEKFWSTEDLGVKAPATEQQSDEAVLAKFMDTTTRVDGRFQVKWPLKSDISRLADNYGLSIGRLRSLLRRLRKTPQTLEKYDKVIKDQLDKGVIEIAPETPDGDRCYYIPHHGVETPQKTTTKLRVVYDASSKVNKEAQSLNECLYRGPVLMSDMGGLILRFRTHPIAFVSDIEKAYLQVGLHEPDRDLVRFLWVKDPNKQPEGDNLMVYRFCRVPFGVITSESLLDMTVYMICESNNSDTATSIADNHFVDNVVDGTATTEHAIEYYSEAKRMFTDAKMNLREWYSNSPEFLAEIAPADKGTSVETKVLGLVWNTKLDTLSLNGPKKSSTDLVSKREILRTVATVFDPLGYCSPVVMPTKTLLQELWKQKVTWDEELPADTAKIWDKCRHELLEIPEIVLPRFAFSRYDANATYELHTFCDASAKAYGAVTYIRTEEEGKVTIAFLLSKVRITPIKATTIPRLELLAAVVGAKVTSYVKEQLRMSAVLTFLWTDSQCVLWWLRSSTVRTDYVQNRINQIIAVGDLEVQYVPTSQNPTDILSRGSTVEDLKANKLWFHGPNWLHERGRASWPQQPAEIPHPKELTKEVTVLVNLDVRQPDADAEIIPFARYSSLNKATRVLAYVLRFINNTKRRAILRRNGLDPEDETELSLQTNEIVKARKLLIRLEQARFLGATLEKCNKSLRRKVNPYIDEQGMIRCSGRLLHTTLAEHAKTPLLLPAASPLVPLVISDAHKRCAHGGASHTLATIRSEYWIPKGRSKVRQYIHRCEVCRRLAGGPYRVPPPPPLPAERVTRSRPFDAIGLDYLGPLFVRESEGERKVWVCLFVCANTRAVHLELVEDMSAETFLLAFRRFMALRGQPRVIYSDNAKTFRMASGALRWIWVEIEADDELRGFLSSNAIEWRFIPEFAPWMGGMYERLVGIVKNALKRSVRGRRLNSVQLRTILAETGHIVNTRPLTTVPDDPEFCLTPHHLIHGTDPDLMPSNAETDDYIPQPSSADEIVRHWKTLSSILNAFWDVWQRDYLLGLREQAFEWRQRAAQGGGPNVGDVVLIGDKLPRQHWKIARVVELETSGDGKCRAAKVQLPTGKRFRRPVKILYPLECPGVRDPGGTAANPAQ